MSQSGNWPYVINLGNSIIGVAVLAMPFCFKQCGIILGIVLLLFCTWLTLASSQLLMKAGVASRRRSYEFLAYYTFGAAGKFTVEFGMIGLQVGTLIAQIVIIGDLGPAIVSKVFGLENTSNLRGMLIVFLCLCIGLPLGLLKDLRTVSRASTICICFYAVFVFYVLSLSAPNLWTGTWYPKVEFWRTEGLFQCLPIFSLSFGCQTQLFLLYDAMPEPSLKAINGIISSAVNFCAVAYLLVGFFGYIAFHELEITGDIITLFPSTFVADIMKLCFVFSIAITFPLIIFPCRASLYTLLFPQHKSHEDIQEDSGIPEFHFKIITIGIVMGSMVIAILVPNVEFILGMNGATMGTLICYIFPALFFVKVMTPKSEGKNIAQLVMVFGITILLVSTAATLYSQDKGHTHPVDHRNLDVARGVEKPIEKPGIEVPHEVKEEKRVEPPIPKAPDESANKVKPNEKVNKELPKKDGVDAVKGPDKDSKKSEEKKVKEKIIDSGGMKADTLGKKKENAGELNQEKESPGKNDEKQKELLDKLVEQHEEQKKLIEEQKQLLQQLKEHKDKDHVAADQKAVQDQQQQLPQGLPARQQPQVAQNQQQPQVAQNRQQPQVAQNRQQQQVAQNRQQPQVAQNRQQPQVAQNWQQPQVAQNQQQQHGQPPQAPKQELPLGQNQNLPQGGQNAQKQPIDNLGVNQQAAGQPIGGQGQNVGGQGHNVGGQGQNVGGQGQMGQGAENINKRPVNQVPQGGAAGDKLPLMQQGNQKLQAGLQQGNPVPNAGLRNIQQQGQVLQGPGQGDQGANEKQANEKIVQMKDSVVARHKRDVANGNHAMLQKVKTDEKIQGNTAGEKKIVDDKKINSAKVVISNISQNKGIEEKEKLPHGKNEEMRRRLHEIGGSNIKIENDIDKFDHKTLKERSLANGALSESLLSGRISRRR